MFMRTSAGSGAEWRPCRGSCHRRRAGRLQPAQVWTTRACRNGPHRARTVGRYR